MSNIQKIQASDSHAIKIIKEKLNDCGGKASIPLQKGELFDIWYDPFGKGIETNKIPIRNQLTWEVLNAAVEVVIQNGGKARKGNARARGARIGNDKLPLDSIEGYVAHKVHGKAIGDSAYGPAFVICSILDWAGICHNERGFCSISTSFMNKLKS